MRLEVGNYHVIPLYTSIRALEVVRREKPDLVLVDVMMPDKNGYEVCQELKTNEETRNIPVVLFTANAEQKGHIEKSSKSAGADDYLLKPFEPNDLFVKIEKLMYNK